MAPIRTRQVGGWVPLPPHHLVSPSCTVSSSFKGLALSHAAIVGASSPTPSRTALALPAAFLLTYVLKSLTWLWQTVVTTKSFTLTFLTGDRVTPTLTSHRLWKHRLCLSNWWLCKQCLCSWCLCRFCTGIKGKIRSQSAGTMHKHCPLTNYTQWHIYNRYVYCSCSSGLLVLIYRSYTRGTRTVARIYYKAEAE